MQSHEGVIQSNQMESNGLERDNCYLLCCNKAQLKVATSAAAVSFKTRIQRESVSVVSLKLKQSSFKIDKDRFLIIIIYTHTEREFADIVSLQFCIKYIS